MKKVFVAFMMVFSLSLSASMVSVNSINALIKKNKAGWIARDNPISQMNESEIKRLLGSADRPIGNALFEDRSKTRDSIDWRNVDGTNWLGPIMDQGNCGSCVAFAAVATLEATYKINSGLSWLNPTFSPQQLFSCGGGTCDFGWRAASVASMLKNNGIVDEACAPYEAGSRGEDLQCKNNYCQGQSERTYKIVDSTTPSYSGGSASAVKEALKKGPLVTTLLAYEDFMVYSSGIYKSVSSKTVGGHAVSLVGFNDEERYWIIRNSWGTGWGENGFARISYDDKSGVAGSTWAYQTTAEDNYISVQSPTNHEYVSGTKNIQVALKKAAITEVVIVGESESIKQLVCQTANSESCELSLDTTNLKDGRYEVYAKSNSKISQVREFLVINHEPQSTISFTGTSKIDLKEPQSGRIEFDIDVKASPVIPKRVTFYVLNDTGKVVFTRMTNEVVEQMRLGFRTNSVPNGKYTIYYAAETPLNGNMVATLSNKEVITIKN